MSIKQTLLKMKQQLSFVRPVVPSSSRHGDFADQAQQDRDLHSDLNKKQKSANMLRQVEEALQRFEDGDYGKCLECDEQIAKARLTALPLSTLCINCQERNEQQR